MAKDDSQGEEDNRQSSEEEENMKKVFEDVGSSIRENRDIEDVPRRKVKEKDKRETTELG